jgi:hypothetical protein
MTPISRVSQESPTVKYALRVSNLKSCPNSGWPLADTRSNHSALYIYADSKQMPRENETHLFHTTENGEFSILQSTFLKKESEAYEMTFCPSVHLHVGEH